MGYVNFQDGILLYIYVRIYVCWIGFVCFPRGGITYLLVLYKESHLKKSVVVSNTFLMFSTILGEMIQFQGATVAGECMPGTVVASREAYILERTTPVMIYCKNHSYF